MSAFLFAGPEKLAVPLAEVKAYLRLDTDDENDLLQSLALAAIDYAERHTGRAFITQTWDEVCGRFRPSVTLPKAPFAELVSITYFDSNNALQTLSSNVYQVHKKGQQPATLCLVTGVDAPTTYDRPDAVTYRYKAGYGLLWSDVPASLRRAIMSLIVHYYESRNPIVASSDARYEVPYTIKDALDQFRVYWQ